MKKIIIFTVPLLLGLMLCSCGSLEHPIGGKQLSESNLAFAKTMPVDDSRMTITYDGKEMSTDQWASQVVPPFPVLYWAVFGNFDQGKHYGLRKFATFVPVFFVTRNQVFDDKGARLQSEIEVLFALTLWYKDRTTPTSADFKMGILWIPGLGPFIGVGPEYFQFFWVPFSEF